jgi:trehalose 6-phosphate synthase
MRLSLRFVLPLAIMLGLIAYALVPLVDKLTLRWFVRDLDVRAELIANAAQEPLQQLLREGSRQKVEQYLGRITQDERLYAIGLCNVQGAFLYKSILFPASIGCKDDARGPLRQIPHGPVHVAHKTISLDDTVLGSLVVVHDMSFVQRRSEDTKKYIFYLFAAIAAVTSLVTVVIAEVSWRGWVAGLNRLLRGEVLLREPTELRVPELRPVARDLQTLLRDLESDRRSRDESQITWSPEALRRILRDDLKGEEVLIVSNREPYIHVRRAGRIEIQRPASGVVTALEPVMRACSGTWIAHGSGSADRDTVDAASRLMVPPERPAYRLRRVWLTKDEEQGYYYGFANSGLWPLCHIAHMRPTFRSDDWAQYTAVNRKFAEAVVREAATRDPIVMVQDYHFALLPRLIRERLPDATIITFWHIPWPNPETFGICPWREEILEGLLGSSILGFHTQFHCNNFLDTVDRYLEARVDRESFAVSFGNELTAVRRYPISIEWPPQALDALPPVAECRTQVWLRYGLPEDCKLGVGIDRLDYIKGIVERLLSVERLFDLHPEWAGRFVFLQVAAPSRSSIEDYQHYDAEVRAVAARINRRFSRPGYEPILLKTEHVEAPDVYEHYRAADLCFVSSLHDGMNLVAKEFVAARDDERGVLILSQFTGASRELPEALIVNPYDIDQCAAALHLALTMPATEQRDRMRSMRGLVQEFNVYRWAGRILLDAAQMRRQRRVLAGKEPRILRFPRAIS